VGAIGDAGGGVDELGWVAGGVADAAELCPSYFEQIQAPSGSIQAPLSSIQAASHGVDKLGWVAGGVVDAAELCLSSFELL
jgi:hypothetical protein